MSNQQSGGLSSYIRPFVRQSRFKMFSTLSTVKEWAGSNASIACVAGSMQNILDSTKMMSMQEDARTHKISSEVMRQNLYKSVTGPGRSRIRNRMPNSRTWSDNDPYSEDTSGSWYPRYYQSLPPTPLQSGPASPSHSPTRKFSFRFLSRGTTPRANSPNRSPIPEEEDDSFRGLASILKPCPRIIRANEPYQDELSEFPGSLAT